MPNEKLQRAQLVYCSMRFVSIESFHRSRFVEQETKLAT